ncbi:MAG: DUF1236 domain-containing protein [Bauldia sp.]
MQYKARLAFAALGLAATMAGPAAAQDLNAIVAVDLSLRAGPGTTFPIVTTIPTAGSVIVYGCLEDRTWCDVSFDGNRGWVSADYLTLATGGQTVVVTQATTGLPPPVTFTGEAYWTQHYATLPIYQERQRWLGPTAGAAGGAVVGALIGGPIGAAIGAAVGGAAGAGAAVAIDPPAEVRTFVTTQTPQPVMLTGEVVIGAGVPDVVTLTPVPNYEYAYANINGQFVLIDPTTRAIVYVFR